MDQVRLIEASQQGDINGLYKLIRDYPDILDLFDEKSFVDTPLHLASTAGQTRFALEIMMLKPSFARKLNQDGYSPIHYTLLCKTEIPRWCSALYVLILTSFVLKGGGYHSSAFKIGDLPVLTEFLSVCPESIEDLTIWAETALHVAVTNKKFEAFEVLLGWLERGFYQGVRHLKEKVLNWKDDQGNSLLHIATSSNQPQVVRLLIKNGVHVNARNLEGLTALDISVQVPVGTIDNIRVMLRDAGAKNAASLENVPTLADYLKSNVLFLEGFILYLMTGKSNMSVQNRNGMLVIAALIVTATYQAGLNPPGGFRYVEPNLISNYGNTTTTTIKNATTIASDPPPYSPVKPLMGIDHYILFQAANFSAFCASLGLIFFLVPSRSVIFPLGYSLVGCYMFSISSLVLPYLGLVLYLPVFILVFILQTLIHPVLYRRLLPCNQLMFSVHTEKWSRQPQQYLIKLRSYSRSFLLGHMVVSLFLLASTAYISS